MPVLFWQWLGQQPMCKIIALQKNLLEERRRGYGENTILLCEHAPCFTYTHIPFQNALRMPQEEFEKMGIPAFLVSRGGGMAFHGPGQITAYFILELSDRALTILSLGRMFEHIAQNTLAHFGIKTTPASADAQLINNSSARGAWVEGKRKIMQRGLGVRCGRTGYAVTQFGFALNVSVDLSYYTTIYPCELDIEMTSMEKELGFAVAVKDVLPRLIDAIAYEFFPYDIQEKKPPNTMAVFAFYSARIREKSS